MDTDDALATLSLEDKVRLLTGADVFTLQGEERLGLAPMAFSDGPTGVRGLRFVGGDEVALLPNATLLAQAWSEDVAHEVGELLADEAERQHIHVVLGPTINLHRSPLGGRLFEAYSEDPLLTGRLAAAYVRGMQGKGVGACLKHLVANESETDRTTVDSVVDEATLRETYLLPFEIAVQDADPWSVMAAYNDVNGVPATEQHHVNVEVLKQEWGWTGLLMSDWFATKSAGPAANGGLDLVMPGPDGPWGEALVAAVRNGEVAEEVVDDHVRRLLVLAERVGALGEPRTWRTDVPGPADDGRRAQLRRLAASAITVLTDDGVLPLDPGLQLAVIGRHALETICMGGGSAQVTPPHQVSVAEGLRAQVDTLEVVDGVEVRSRAVPADLSVVSDPVSGRPGMRVRAYAADGRMLSDAHVPSSSASFGFDDDLPELPARAVLTARVGVGGAAELGVLGVGRWSVRVGDATHEVDLGLTGADPGEALLRPPAWTVTSERGDVELEGEVAVPATGFGRFALVARPAPRPVAEVLAEAVHAAEGCDVAVVVVGLTEEQETEAADKSTLALPGEQDAMVSSVAAHAPRTVVVVNAATPVLMPWLDEVDAVLWVGLPGQEGGHAVADALLGRVEPAGRLVTSFPSADGAAPAWEVVPTDGKLPYTDGSFVGYRGYEAGHAPAPAFWLGHGLGLGRWEYGAPVARRTVEGVEVEVEVANVAHRGSSEVVQVYYRPHEEGQPVRLVGWTRVAVAAGATATARVRCDPRVWRRWTDDGWADLSDAGTVLVARGLGDVRGSCRLGPR